MSRIKHWSALLLSRVDAMASRMENHEALVDGAIQDVRRSLAGAKVQLARVQQDRNALQGRLERARHARDDWSRRAVAVADDEPRALECLRRKHACTREAEAMARQLAQQTGVEARLTQDIRAVEERLSGLRRQRNLLRTRASTAAAKGAMATAASPLGADVGEVLERWEMQVTEAELEQGAPIEGDPDGFEDSFQAAEERQALRDELHRLTGEDPQ